MSLVDANLLLYAKIQDFTQHATARAGLDDKLNDVVGAGPPRQSLRVFVRLVSNPRIFEHPLTA